MGGGGQFITVLSKGKLASFYTVGRLLGSREVGFDPAYDLGLAPKVHLLKRRQKDWYVGVARTGRVVEAALREQRNALEGRYLGATRYCTTHAVGSCRVICDSIQVRKVFSSVSSKVPRFLEDPSNRSGVTYTEVVSWST